MVNKTRQANVTEYSAIIALAHHFCRYEKWLKRATEPHYHTIRSYFHSLPEEDIEAIEAYYRQHFPSGNLQSA